VPRLRCWEGSVVRPGLVIDWLKLLSKGASFKLGYTTKVYGVV
jgi:hypothetical protein